MAKIWKEEYTPGTHYNKMWELSTPEVSNSRSPLHWVYLVRVCSFTFEFHSTEQIIICLDYYSEKVHPSSRIPWKELPDYGGDHSEVQRWFERLPMYLLEEPKRQKVVKALSSAVEQFQPRLLKK